MMRRRSRAARPVTRPSRHGRHGRENRSPVVRPPLPPIDTRVERFDVAVGAAAEFLRSQLRHGVLHALDAGHWPQIDAAAEAARIMLEIGR